MSMLHLLRENLSFWFQSKEVVFVVGEGEDGVDVVIAVVEEFTENSGIFQDHHG